MISAALHVLALAALVVLARRQIVAAGATWRIAGGIAGMLAGAIFLGPTQERVYAATTGFGGWADTLAAAGPAGDFTAVVVLAAVVAMALPRLRGMMVRNGAAPLECCAANDLNHRS